MVPVTVGLCAACAFSRVLENRNGSSFWLCQRSRTDPAFPRYPRLPVVACAGFEPKSAAPPPPADLPDGPRSL